MNIMFVCTGNTCRSPMAGGLLEKVVEDAGDDCINVDTSGISVYVPTPASENAVSVMESMDVDISNHESKQITKEDIISADLVLTMTESHRNILMDLYPEFGHKVFTISEYAYGTEDDISDPFGGDEDEYRACAMEIKNAVDAVYAKIKANSQSL